MQEVKQKNNKILAVIIAALLIAGAFFLGAETASKNCADNNGNANLTVERDDAEEAIKPPVVVYSFDKNNKESTVFSGLLNYESRNNVEVKYNNNYEYGVFIESIGGVKNGDDGKYWQYYVNDVLGDVAADKKVLSKGDVAEWRFEEVPF